MTSSPTTVRAARPDDAGAIVTVIRAAFRPSLFDLFIYGCPGIERYVREQIAADARGGDTMFDVAVRDGRLLGTIEVRALPTSLFLNYVAVAPDAQSAGLGTRLLRAALDRAAGPAHRLMTLDVDEGNGVALRWYEALGFVPGTTTEWIVLPLPDTSGETPGSVVDAPQAAVCHDAFGFSRITVFTPTARHDVGLLGTRWFRVTSRAALDDPVLVATLHAVDPARRILALLPPGAITDGGFSGARRVTVSRRLTCALDVLRARLAARPAGAKGTPRSGPES